MNIKVSASILSADLAHLQDEINSIEKAGADLIHIDVMDGHFVPNLTFGAPVVKWIESSLPFDIHLMVENPENYIDDFAKSLPKKRNPNGQDIITVHAEACTHLHRVVQQIKAAGFRVGVALNPASSLSLIEEIVDQLDMVLVMTVNPGYSGQKFIESALNKVRDLRANFSDLDIQVDGGVDDRTANLCIGAGANVIVSASYLFGSKSRKEAVRILKGLD